MQEIILKNLIHNREYCKKVIPHVKAQFFTGPVERQTFKLIKDYIKKYKTLPKIEELKVELSQLHITETQYKETIDYIDKLENYEKTESFDWLINSTESWAKHQALSIVILEGADLISNKSPQVNGLPEKIRKALQIEFNSDVGLELLSDEGIKEKWDRYNKKILKYPTGIDYLDRIFNGGIETKAVTCILAGTNIGKTAIKIALGSNFLRNGHDILYITLEMSEEKIAQRFDANFLQVPINDITNLTESDYRKNLYEARTKTNGRLFIKEYAPKTITVNNIRALLEDLEIKRNFKPKIIIVDYLNLMLSAHVSGENTYILIKSISEELRGLAVENDVAVLTSTQGNRASNAADNSDLDMTNVSESIGLAQTMDAMIAVIMPEQLRSQGMQIWKILKNRFGDIVFYKFPVLIDFALCSVKDIDKSTDDVKIFDNDDKTDKKMKNTNVFLDE